MSAARRARPRMSVTEFLTWVESTPDDGRWELLDGEPTLMTAPRERH